MSSTWTIETVKDRCDEDGDCWIWRDGVNSSGHPQARINGKAGSVVRRFVVQESGRALTSYKQRVIDTCRNRRCCNPEHLAVVSFSTVIRRTYKEGSRCTQGEYLARVRQAQAQSMTKLDFDSAKVLRRRMAAGESIAELSRETGMCRSALRDVKNNKTWRELAPGASVFAWRPA